jgi:type IV secretory pathway TraG/TraD family ATPase VirD4
MGLARTGVAKKHALDPATNEHMTPYSHRPDRLAGRVGIVTPAIRGGEMSAAADDLAHLRARIAAAGSPLYLGAGTAGAAFAPPQQAVLVLGPPRSGKTSTLVIPNVLAAAGPVVSTSTKPDVLHATWEARAGMGRCWLFDPSGSTPSPPGVTPLRWSPVPACRSWETALLTARAMAGAAARPPGWPAEGNHWTERAEALLAPLLHAAALCNGGVDQLVRWVNRHDLDTGLAMLFGAGSELAADILTGLAETDRRELSGIWSTAAGILAAYRSEVALAASRHPNFDPARLPATTDTVYVCASSRHQALAAPLVVGLIEQVRAAAYRAPMSRAAVTLALDEAANIAPLPDLPAIIAEGGSQGLVTLACFQDLSQARVRWSQAADGFLSLFGVKVVLPGIGDLRTLELVSRLGGEGDAPVRSVSRRRWLAGRGGVTVTSSTRRQRRLPVEAVAQLPLGTAILLDGAKPPSWLRLTPWYCTPPFECVTARTPRRAIDRGLGLA